MQTATAQSIETPKVVSHLSTFPPLALETRTTITTAAAAYYLNRKPQTLRGWACLENGPIRPLRINGRLGWKVADIKVLLNLEVA